MLYSNNLSLEEFGLFYMVLGFYSLISIFNDLGFTETLSYYGVKFYEKKDFESLKLSYYYAIIMQLGTGIIISSIILLSSKFISIWWFGTIETKLMLEIMTIYFIGINTLKPMISIFLVKLNLFWYKISELFYLTGIFSLSFILFKYDFLPNQILISTLYSSVFLALVILYFFIVRWKFKEEFKNHELYFNFKLYIN